MRAAWLLAAALLLGAPAALRAEAFPGGDAAAEMERGLGGESGVSDAEKQDLASDKLAWGGVLSTQYIGTSYDGWDEGSTAFTNPSQAFLYLDSRLEGNARVLVRGKAFYDPSTATPLTPAAVTASLEELKMSFDLGDKVFVTAGRQKIKHGVARFFNPSDLLNLTPRDFFLQTDERPGVDLLRLHLPSDKSNYYLGVLGRGAAKADQVGVWARGEFGYGGEGLFSGGELSAAVLVRKDDQTKYAFDLSQAVGIFDVYAETALQLKNQQLIRWDAASTVGISTELRYADRSTNTVTLQAEYFQAGELAKTAGFVVYLPKPGSLQDTRFLLYNLYSLVDESGITRLDIIQELTRQITGSVYAGKHWGVSGGLFNQPYQTADLGVRLDANF